MEEWKDIEGYEGYYQVSNLGRIKSLEREIVGKLGVMKFKERILKPGVNLGGYLFIVLYKNSKSSSKTVHRLVAITFVHNPHNKKEVNHKNGIKTDNRLENLEWATPSENVRHAFNTGLFISVKGEAKGQSKLTDDQAREIKYGHKDMLQKDIAKIYGVDPTIITNIRRCKGWKHI